MNFRVDLDIFRGPLDLLLYLVRKHELEIADIPIAVIAEQFMAYIEILEVIDINAVGDFLDMASTLVEIKSRLVLPHGGEETDELLDPRADLVQQLLEYKKFKDAASLLDDRSRDWQQHYARLVDDLPPRQPHLAEQPIQEAELWDLVSAFGRIIRESQVVPTANIVYDDTPIHVYMRRIHRMLAEEGRAAFSQLFAPGMHKSALIGVFLSILELARHHSVLTEQVEGHGEIWIRPGEGFDPQWNLADIDPAKAAALADKLAAANLPLKPR
ncbi:MAG: segregation/condensation protein A [Pirellulales bacterium]